MDVFYAGFVTTAPEVFKGGSTEFSDDVGIEKQGSAQVLAGPGLTSVLVCVAAFVALAGREHVLSGRATGYPWADGDGVFQDH